MRDRDDLPIFRPRIGKRTWPSGGTYASLRNALLSLIRRRTARRALAPSHIAGRTARTRRAACGRQAHVARLTPTGAKAASLHLGYIERDGVEKDGAKGLLYNAEAPTRTEAFEQPRLGEKHQFRLIVSPEDAGELDLTDYVQRPMTRVARDLGRKLE